MDYPSPAHEQKICPPEQLAAAVAGLPRPLVLLDELPRNSTGKLPRNHLQALFAEKVANG